jgi:hypothetical protein
MKNSRVLVCGVLGSALVGIALPVAAVDVAALAERSGLTERQVRMVLGAPTAYVEYRPSYARASRKLRAIVGSDGALREIAEEFQIEQEYTFEVLVDRKPIDQAAADNDASAAGDRAASLRSVGETGTGKVKRN